MTLLIPTDPTENLLPYDGIVNNFGDIFVDDAVINTFNSLLDSPILNSPNKAHNIAHNIKHHLYTDLLNDLPWQSDKVTLFGKTHITKRQIVSMGDNKQNNELSYTYSGNSRPVIAWDAKVFAIKQLVEQHLRQIGVDTHFNTGLLNYYPSGMEGMGYHADDEPELGYQPIVASVSLGATRKFVLKHKHTQQKIECHLKSGQLIVMRGDTQQHWKHTVTKTKKVDDGRISLTFRKMV